MDKYEYYYSAVDILEEFTSSYSQVDKERLAKILKEMCDKERKETAKQFAEMAYKVFLPLCDEEFLKRKLDEICKGITEGKV